MLNKIEVQESLNTNKMPRSNHKNSVSITKEPTARFLESLNKEQMSHLRSKSKNDGKIIKKSLSLYQNRDGQDSMSINEQLEQLKKLDQEHKQRDSYISKYQSAIDRKNSIDELFLEDLWQIHHPLR